jgi:hypothetical protein
VTLPFFILLTVNDLPCSFTKKLMEKEELAKSEFIKPLFEKKLYANPWSTYEDRGLVDVFKWITSRPKRVFMPKEQLDAQIPIVKPDFHLLNNPVADDIQYTWIGTIVCFYSTTNLIRSCNRISSNGWREFHNRPRIFRSVFSYIIPRF